MADSRVVAARADEHNSSVGFTELDTMSDIVFFAHANGFPSATYGKLFAALEPEFVVRSLPQHGHDPRFPVEDNWQSLVDELLHHVRAQARPVWGVGHSLGGVLHLHAALRQPALYRGVIMLDSPLLSSTDRWLIRAAKRMGLIDRLTPAGRTLGRRERFADRASAREYFLSKALFKDFDPDCLEAYLDHGLKTDEAAEARGGAGLRLAFDPDTEIRIYRSVPHVSPGRPADLALPVAVIGGERSRVVLPHHGRNARRLPRGEFHRLPGGHMFPFERPLMTAQLVRELLHRWQLEGQAR